MRARFLKFFSFLFLTSFFLSSCKITVNEGSQNAIDAIESEVYDSSSLEDLSSLTVEDDTGCLVFQTPANPDGTTLHYTLTVDIDGTDYTRELNSDQIIVIRNLTLGKHKVTCKAFKGDSSLYAIGSSDAIFRSGETATLELILERLPDASELVSISASYTGSYQKVNVIPSIESFNIVETYNDENTATGYKDNYEVLSPSVTNYMQKVGSIPITIRRKNTEIQDTVNVPFKYEPRESYNNPDISNTNISIVQNSSPAPTISISARSPTEYTIYGTSTKVKDDVSYQWLKNGSEITGATNSSYTVPTDTAGTFKYKCKVTYTPDETYATRTSPVYAISDEITVTVTSATTDAITTWSELKSAIAEQADSQTPLTLQISGILEANSYIEVNGNVSLVAANSSGATIHRASDFKSNMFSVSGSNASLTLGTNQLPLTLDGKAKNGSEVAATKPLIAASNGATIIINNGVTLQNNKNSTSGGAISLNNSTLYMYNGKITGNTCTQTSSGGGGGGVYLENGSTMNMLGGEISGNTATYNGGGIYAKGSSTSVFMEGTATVSRNFSNANSSVTNGGGGGVYLYNDASLNVTNRATIKNNEAKYSGGGIYNTVSGKVTIWSTEAVTGNTALDSSGHGNQIYNTYKIGDTNYTSHLD